MGFIPPIFVAHGTPAAAIDEASRKDYEQWARDLPRPRGVLVVSSRWHASTLSRGSTATRPSLLRDYVVDGDARAKLERVTYDAPGAPELAYDLAMALPVEPTERGWDMGVWSPLRRLYPAADVPVLQLSLVAGASPRRLFGIGKKIGVLAAQGYLIVGSGGITHSAKELAPGKDAPPAEWARAFDTWVANLLSDAEIDELFAWRTRAPDARRAHPTPEHLDPLFVVAGAASLYENAVGFPVRGFEHGALSRRCVQFGR